MRIKVSKTVGEKLIGLSKKDFKVATFRSSGPGGQHRNKTDTAVRLTHTATGIFAEAADSKSQIINKQNAFKKLVHRLIEYYKEDTSERRMNSGWAEKVRTYSAIRDVVIDHRTGVTQRYKDVLNGNIDVFIEASVSGEKE